jgi:uncharacterized protein DUF6582
MSLHYQKGLNILADPSKPYGSVAYADPGYQSDKKSRYPIDSRAHAKAAWSYINQGDNARKYTANQLKRIKGRIKAALSKFGVSVAAESAGWTVGEPAAVSEALAEWWPGADPQTSGSYCLTATNGPTSLTISSCSLDPEDLDPILRAAADAACKALAALDPDMDGDIDVPGAPGADTDHDMGRESAPGDTDDQGESAPDDAEESPAAEPGTDTETEVPAMPDTATTETAAGQAPAATDSPAPAAPMVTLTAEQFQALIAPRVTETAAPAPVAPVAAETAPATPAAPVAETAEQRMARLTALAEAKVAEAAAAAGLQVGETDEQIMERLIEERLVPLRQAAAEKTGVQRKGLLENLADGEPGTAKVLMECDGGDLAALAATAYPRRA